MKALVSMTYYLFIYVTLVVLTVLYNTVLIVLLFKNYAVQPFPKILMNSQPSRHFFSYVFHVFFWFLNCLFNLIEFKTLSNIYYGDGIFYLK